MFTLSSRYLRYALAALSSLGFGMNLQQPVAIAPGTGGQSREEDMVTLGLRYAQYAFAALSSLGFGINMQQLAAARPADAIPTRK